ncbi:MAG: hypothetical protein M3405_13100 [Acidobacteriota bacterium]|jgi:hypothetical protein|nr:hypothetical protein [Acidobacteriota bacterium]
MQQRKIKLGKGEFEHIDDVEMPYSVRHARDYFFDAIKEVKPEILDDLADEPYRLYKAAGLALERERYEKEFENLEFYDRIRAMARLESQHRWNHPSWYEHYEKKKVNYNQNIRALQKSIFDWSKKHNLNVDWCRARAYETLNLWYFSHSFYEHRIWTSETEMQPMIATHKGERDFVFRINSNYPMFGFRSDEEKRITRAFKQELKSFLVEREKLAKKNGMKKPKQKRTYLHFIWLARWQLNEDLTHEKIAEQDERSNSIEVQAVSKAIKELAKLINLPLRKSKRGKKPTFTQNS